MDYLMMSLLPFCALNMAAVLLSMQGQKDLIKYLNLCFDDERRSCGFEMTWGWLIIVKRSFLGELSL